MAQSNAAATIPSYQTHKTTGIHENIKPLRVSKFEKLIIITGMLSIVACTLMLLTAKIQLSTNEASRQVEVNQFEQDKNTNNMLHEEKAELTSHDRLINYAHMAGFSLNSKNLKYVH